MAGGRGRYWRVRVTAALTVVVVVVVVVAALPSSPARAQDARSSAPPPSANPAAATAPAASELDQIAAILANPAAPQQQRDEAASRLVARRGADSVNLQRRVLNDTGMPASQAAVARALAEDVLNDPDQSLINPLFVALNAGIRPAGAALANYYRRDEVLIRLTDAATRGQNEPIRLTAIEALGRIPEKSAVLTLIDIVTGNQASDRGRAEAADALVALTGLTDNARDAQRWAQFRTAIANRNDGDVRNELLVVRSARLNVLSDRHGDLVDAVERELSEQYRAALPQARPAMLMRMLTSDAAELRALGAATVLDDRLQGRPVPEQAVARLREMVGDGDPHVRLAVIKGLAGVNDKQALDVLLAQLRYERNPDVRAAIARALGPIGDPHAAGPLVDLLGDPSLVVAKAATDSFRDLCSGLAANDRAVAARAARALEDLLGRAERARAQDLRESVVAAMATLAEPSLQDTLTRLANRDQPVRVRREAIRGLGNLGNPRAADYIGPQFLGSNPDPDPDVQAEALLALGKLDATAYWQTIAGFAKSPEPKVQQAAWTALQGIMPHLPAVQLASLGDTFNDNPNQKVQVYRVLADTQRKANQLDDWADTEMNIGELLMKLNRPAESAESYQAAFEQKSRQPNTPQMVMQRLIRDLLRARLQARQYDQAAAFAGENVNRDPSQQQTVGPEFWKEAERLTDEGRTRPAALDDALALIAAARQMKPPLNEQYLNNLNGIERQIQAARSGAGSGGTGAGATTAPPGQ